MPNIDIYVSNIDTYVPYLQFSIFKLTFQVLKQICLLDNLQVLLSDSFRASFQKVVSVNQKKSIIVLLLRLSCGWRPETKNFPNPKCSDIIKCVKVEGLYIIYSLDIEKGSKYKQVLKIWDIKPLTDVKGVVDCLSNIHELYTDEFLNLCMASSHKGYIHVFSFEM